MNLAIPSRQTPLISYQHLIMTRNYLRVYDHEPVDLSTQHQALTLMQHQLFSHAIQSTLQ